jgi:predicted DNA-binding transcriptional regulator AlpA
MTTDEKILQEIRRLHKRLDDIEGQLREMRRENSSDLVPLQALAEELGVARSTIYRRLEQKGIPIRTASGAPKEEGDRSAAYVSRSEWEGEEELHTRTVREEDGQYD